MSFNQRINKVKDKISKQGIEGIYVTNLTNVRYLTGLTGSAGSVLIVGDEQHFFTDGRYIEQSKEQVRHCKINIVGSAHFLSISKQKLIKGNSKIGLESDHVNMSLFQNSNTKLYLYFFEGLS